MSTLFATSIDLAQPKNTLLGDVLSLTKARLSFLVIFTCALGLFLAPRELSLVNTLVTILATSGLVAAACMINCVMEKDIDAQMERTRHRPLPAGRLSSKTVMSCGVILVALCLSALYLYANALTSLLGLVATLSYLFLYTPMKQKSSWALFAGAIPGAIPPLMGWTAATGEIGSVGLVLFAILFIWQVPHFLSISIYHADDYKKAGLKTFPADVGNRAVVHKILGYTIILGMVSALPYYLGIASLSYLVITFLIATAFTFLAVTGLKHSEESAAILKWSRHYFYGTLVYLPSVFLAMLYFRVTGY